MKRSKYNHVIIVSLVAILISSTIMTSVNALDNATAQMYALNNILGYDDDIYANADCLPSGTASSFTNPTTINGDDNKSKAWNYLVEANIPNVSNNTAVLAGILGNFQHESDFLPFIKNGAYHGIWMTPTTYSPGQEIVNRVAEAGYSDYWTDVSDGNFSRAYNANIPEAANDTALQIELDVLIHSDLFQGFLNALGRINDKLGDNSEAAAAYGELFNAFVGRGVISSSEAQKYIDAGTRTKDDFLIKNEFVQDQVDNYLYTKNSQYYHTLFQEMGNSRNYAKSIYNEFSSSAANLNSSSDSNSISFDTSSGDNASIAMDALTKAGYSKNAAAAIIGNLQGESGGLNPKRLEGGAVVDDDFVAYENGSKTFDGGFGIAQWTSAGRVANLQEYADSINLPVSSLEAQLRFMIDELSSYGYDPSTLNSLTLDEAVWEIYKHYESPASSDNYESLEDIKAHLDEATDYTNRLQQAKIALGVDPNASYQYSGLDCVNTTSASGNASFTLSGGNSNGYTGSYPYFLQSDPRWGNLMYGSGGINGASGSTISSSGCGPTSFAMLATALTGKEISPADTADIAGKAGMHIAGSGSSWEITRYLADTYGLQFKDLASEIGSSKSKAIDTINQYLSDGWMIHTSGKGSYPFSTGGHYIGIFGVTSDGKWIIADSADGGLTPDQSIDPNDLINAGMALGNIKAVK